MEKMLQKTLSTLSLMVAMTLPFGAIAAPYKATSVADGGTISGKVSFSGTPPGPIRFSITKNLETCGTGVREVHYIRVTNGSLNDVVVYLDKIKEGKAWSAEIDNPEVDQKKCSFNPFMGVMRNGDTVSVLNSDPVTHNIHPYEIGGRLGKARRTIFNQSQPADVKVIKRKIKLKRGVAMKLECDQHDFMHGFRFVAKTPYYAVVKEDGTFSIDNIPPGEYTVKAWHGTLQEQKSSITVAAKGAATANFTFKE